MLWLDGIPLDENLISGRASGSNGENDDSNNHSKAATKAKRRRHAHFKLNGRLDRKSSRGMIYENEELRLRTININAEVERGQSDIKRLRRENEHLRREIWTLRDECDRLNKRFKARLLENTNDHHGACNVRGSGGSGHCTGRRGSCAGVHSNSNSEDSDSCDTCKGDNDDDCKYASNECCIDGSCNLPKQQQQFVDDMAAKYQSTHTSSSTNKNTANSEDQPLHATFDHLSVVSEETLSNCELVSNAIQSGNLPSLVGPLTPLTPVEMVANELNDLQSLVPPLSYFENIVQQHMGPNSITPESALTTNSGKTVIQTNGWDYNLQSPFTQRKYPSNSSSSSSNARSPAQTLTTFVPPCTTLSPHYTTEAVISSATSAPTIETVAITTVPASVPTTNSPKHFFAPLKPRLKINTSLANRNLTAGTQPPLPPVVPPNYDPPDIFVTNALASPYQRANVATTTVTTNSSAVPTTYSAANTLPQRQSPQVSPRQRRRHNHKHHEHQQHHHQHYQQQVHHHHQQHHVATVDFNVADDSDAGENNGAAAGPNTKFLRTMKQRHEPYIQQQQQQQQKNFNPLFIKLNEPIYATAQKNCNNLITAPAVTQPLMTTTIVTTLPTTTTTFSTTISSCMSSTTPTTMTATTTLTTTITSTMTTMTLVGQKQTDSANLEAILNDIETISEDILAIQLEKQRNKQRENQSTSTTAAATTTAITQAQTLQQSDKSKKPYRSEMNLLLTYDGANPTITPATASSTSINTIQPADNTSTARRARSLEREHTESPSPNVPDAMAPFPYNRTYIGFDQLNATVNTAKPPLPPPPSQVKASVNGIVGSSKPDTPIKPTPPTPPTRKLSLPFGLRQTGQTLEQAPQQQVQASTPTSIALTPNKSHLFAAIANAAVAKRAQFRATPSHLSRSLDTDGLLMAQTEQETQAAESARRKARRVSIVCAENTNEEDNAKGDAATTATTSTLGSCVDLQAQNPIILHLRQTSHSTPNSPHSMRRGSNGIIETLNVGSTHHHSHPPGTYPLHHPLQHSGSVPVAHRKASQDSTRGSATAAAAAADLAAAAAAVVASRSKCSRRHSDGTVASGVQRISGSSGHHHHHHQRHHHQHQQSLISNNPHQSHHSHQESNDHDTATSLSDHNSNSLASSRESSTSFSLRSQRRKISVSSHTGGKIPWCGCWGNGCL